jgi:hypothetical protein
MQFKESRDMGLLSGGRLKRHFPTYGLNVKSDDNVNDLADS